MKKLILSVLTVCTFVTAYAQNISKTDLEYRPVQFSIYPGLSSNGEQSERYYTSFSFGIFGDKSGGVSGAQVSGFINNSRYFIKGLQLGGWINNIGKAPTTLTMPFRLAPDSIITPDASLKGAQIGGIINTVAGDVKGLQLGGIINTAEGDVNGVQIGGIINSAKGELRGVQIGLINRTGKSQGFQLGLINIADSSSGATMGLINLVRHGGYYRAELWAGETFYTNAAIKMGTQKIYSILALGWGPHDGYHHFGYGVGLGFPLNQKGMYLDVLSYQVNEDEIWTDKSTNLLEQLRFTKEHSFGDMALVYGATINVFISNRPRTAPGEDPGMKIEPWSLYEHVSKQSRVVIWPGVNLGVRL